MADNVAITAGAGTNVATDDIGGVHHQRMKVSLGADGTANDLDGSTARGAFVDPRPYNDRIVVQSAGLTTATTAYTSGDQLGTVLTFTAPPRASGGYATLVGAVLIDEAKVTGPVELYIFDRSVTAAADNAAADFSDADMANLVGIIDFPSPKTLTSNYVSLGTPLPQVLKANAADLYGYLVTRSGHTFFAAVTNLRVILNFQKD